jgi:O-antigen/teichoic acid export membrane protein
VKPVRAAGVAQTQDRSFDGGEGRLLASGVLLQQVAQACGLVALLAVVTLLARRLSVAELGAYGLVASLAGYLLVLRNSVASSAVRAMAGAADSGERARTYSAAVFLYGVVGLATGVVIAAAALAVAGLMLGGDLASDARVGGVLLGVMTAAGILASVNLDALRAERLFVRAAAIEIAAVAIYLVVMLVLILGGAGLGAVIAVSGALPLLSGTLSSVAVRGRMPDYRWTSDGVSRVRLMKILPTAGWLLVVETANLVMYASQRLVLGAYTSARTVGLFEGPVRAHNLLYALSGALAVPVVPTAARYVASEDRRRLAELAVRGTRYTLGLAVPLVVTLMVLAEPTLEVWLGDRYGGGGAALTIIVSYWLLYSALLVTPGFLVGAGCARAVGLVFITAAAANVALSLVLTPAIGLEGPAIATAVPLALAFPVLLRTGLRVAGVSLGELSRRAFLPAYATGAVLAGALLLLRAATDLESLATVAVAAVGAVLAGWLLFYALWLDSGERRLLRSLLQRQAKAG